ncbi:unnamed protein product [Rhizoctonia solani]|uniref:Uncharacterized protein n=1 Tax=Rhizoctonia solani TaxID=456999 RepID=A0A8H3C691_9AGAM|nr:unnamed protein product [Rhizoctonia solani]
MSQFTLFFSLSPFHKFQLWLNMRGLPLNQRDRLDLYFLSVYTTKGSLPQPSHSSQAIPSKYLQIHKKFSPRIYHLIIPLFSHRWRRFPLVFKNKQRWLAHETQGLVDAYKSIQRPASESK